MKSFIEDHKSDDLNEFLLKYKSVFNIPASIIADQIKGRKKAKEKLPSWYKNDHIIFPPSINLEQCSSEQTAIFKATMITGNLEKDSSRNRMLDLTGGFGVDSFFLGGIFKEVHFIEPNKNLLEIVEHNHLQLGKTNMHYYNSDAETFLDSSSLPWDFIYIDPSRRSQGNQKVFFLNQCEPNIEFLQEKIWKFTNHLLIKTSPLLDIHQGLKGLKHVKKVSIISLENECKELLFFCEKDFDLEPVIEATNIGHNAYTLPFRFSDERNTVVPYADPSKYLYEPNAAILKGGAFKTVAALFSVSKIHPNTHLYTSEKLVQNFPGKIFEIKSLIKANTNNLKEFFPDGKANITARNYASSIEDLRKKTKLKDGGEKFLIAFSGMKKKFLAAAERLDGL